MLFRELGLAVPPVVAYGKQGQRGVLVTEEVKNNTLPWIKNKKKEKVIFNYEILWKVVSLCLPNLKRKNLTIDYDCKIHLLREENKSIKN